jgi:RimJ/RimL family protein N-acetyltransferase
VDRRIITRSTSAATLNFFVNHSSLRDTLFQDGWPEYVDMAEMLARTGTYFFIFPGGCLLFWRVDDNNYEADIYCLPRTRGAVARQAAQEALSVVFSEQNPPAIKARASRFNAKSRHFIAGLGFRRVGIDPGAFLKNGVRHDVVRFELGKDAWQAQSDQSLAVRSAVP